jgi:Tol biopolymer transport system component
MNHAAWVIGLAMGMTGCSGSIGGDLPGFGIAAGGGSSSSTGGDLGTAGNDSGSGGANAAGGFPIGGVGPTVGGAGGETGFPVAGGVNVGGQSPTGYEPESSCHSPVDAWIAFDSDAADFNRELYVVRPDGSQLTRLTSDAAIDREPSFSPTGDRLSFTSDRSGSLQVHVLDLKIFVVTQVTHRAEGAEHSSFSSDGQLLTFQSGRSVYTIKPDGSDEALIVSEDNSSNNPQFIGNTRLMFDRRNEIDAINLDQTDFRGIVANATTDIIEPTASPRGDEIAYATRCYLESVFSIWTASSVLRADTCTGHRVTPLQDSLDDSHPSWGPANTFAYQRVDRRTGVGRITLLDRAPGSLACSLTPADQDSRNPSWTFPTP